MIEVFKYALRVLIHMTGQDNLSKEEPKDRFLKTVTHSLNLCGFGKATSHAHRDAVVTLLSRGEYFFYFSLRPVY